MEYRQLGRSGLKVSTITLGTMTLVYTLIKANAWGWGSARTVGGLALSVVLLAAFLWIERRHEATEA